jgi:CRISPR-associated protein Cas6
VVRQGEFAGKASGELRMYWQEDRAATPHVVTEEVVDLAFAVRGQLLSVDHAYALAQAIGEALPWLLQDERAGIHEIHVADSGNGWYRPEEASGQLLHLSRRTKLTLRLPQERLDEARRLTGCTLDVAGQPLQVGEATVRPLHPFPTLFARHVVAAEEGSEEQFLDGVARWLREGGFPIRRLLCGRSHVIRMPDHPLFTRSLMVADLDPSQSVRLQQHGLGPKRHLGCGLFIPHKGIKPVAKADTE